MLDLKKFKLGKRKMGKGKINPKGGSLFQIFENSLEIKTPLKKIRSGVYTKSKYLSKIIIFGGLK